MSGIKKCPNFIAVSGIKIENKLGLSWAKLSHLNSIELRSTAFSRLSCSWKSQTELVCYKMCIFNKRSTRRQM